MAIECFRVESYVIGLAAEATVEAEGADEAAAMVLTERAGDRGGVARVYCPDGSKRVVEVRRGEVVLSVETRGPEREGHEQLSLVE